MIEINRLRECVVDQPRRSNHLWIWHIVICEPCHQFIPSRSISVLLCFPMLTCTFDRYLGNMGVRSSMSISITAFGTLWGLVAMHCYGRFGHRVSFPVRQLSKLLGESISKNIERLSYAKRLHSRKLINTQPTNANPSGVSLCILHHYIVDIWLTISQSVLPA